MIFNWSIIVLVVTDVFTTIIETLSLSERVLLVFNIFEIFTVIVFTIEYILRVWTADLIYKQKNPLKARIKYAFNLMMIVDFMAIAPFYLHFIFPISANIFRVFRVLRILRLLKVNHYVKALSHVGDVLKRKALQLFISMLIIFTLMIVASILMYTVEHDVQPEIFPNALSGLWWAVTTLSTIGYGDIYPVTVLGKVFGTLFSLLNIGLIAVPTGIISAGFIENTPEKSKKRKNKRFCPYCGENIEE
ncbi:MAG: ion transporter [Oscillospiraceae bacterium]|nr:ion transporter [Oscillospiraceae bacterium]